MNVVAGIKRSNCAVSCLGLLALVQGESSALQCTCSWVCFLSPTANPAPWFEFIVSTCGSFMWRPKEDNPYYISLLYLPFLGPVMMDWEYPVWAEARRDSCQYISVPLLCLVPLSTFFEALHHFEGGDAFWTLKVQSLTRWFCQRLFKEWRAH